MRAFPITLVLCLLALPAQGQEKVFLAFGDSITVGHGDGAIDCLGTESTTAGYPPRLRDRLGQGGVAATFLNFGVCGERTAAGLSRLDGVLEHSGDVVVIMEGTNDISGGIGLETTLFNLNEMGSKTVRAAKVPLMASVIPRGPGAGRDTNNGKTYTLAHRLEEDSAEEGWVFADPFHRLFDLADLYERYYADSLHPNSAGYSLMTDAFVEPALDALAAVDRCQGAVGPCVDGEHTLCLNDRRFRAEVIWRKSDGSSGSGRAAPLTAATGGFWFFDPDNVELLVKLHDGRGLNTHFWVFYAGLTSFELTLTVTDTVTGVCREYRKQAGEFASLGDTEAFFATLEEGIGVPPGPCWDCSDSWAASSWRRSKIGAGTLGRAPSNPPEEP